ncbi:hypothetical protein MBLNU457_4324t1 [Dothideomycetes sp. NU457]
MSIRRSSVGESARGIQEGISLLPISDRISEEKSRDDLDDAHLKAANSKQTPPTSSRIPLPLQGPILIILFILNSSGLIIFNKYILSTLHFPFPVSLTTWHLTFATVMTQILARTTRVLDSRKKNPMTARTYCTSILPIGVCFSLSLACGNMVYLYLTVSFIQMLKAASPIATLLATWAFRLRPVSYSTLSNILVIALGVAIASYGEVSFNVIGIILQLGGVVFEALRIVMVQKLLTPSNEQKMDPLVSLYYFAPACAVMNGLLSLVVEGPRISWEHVLSVGYGTFVMSALVAFTLNVITVLVIDKTSSLALCLSGIVKTILIISTSVLVFGDSVSVLQFVGFSIATLALLYYQLGWDAIRGVIVRPPA